MKKLSRIAVLLLVISLLAGCSKAPAETTDASTDPSTAPSTEVTSEPTEESMEPEESGEVTSEPTEESSNGSSDNASNGSSSGSSSNGSSSGSGNSSKPSAGGSSSSSNSGSGSSSSSAKPSHTHSYSSTVVAPTCTSGGYTKHTCSCGKSYTDSETSAAGHSWGSWATTKEPTTSEEGQQTRTCSRCGATDSQSIAKLPAPALDLKAAMAQGNAYAQSQYGAISNSSFYPSDGICGYDFPPYLNFQRASENGQEYLNRCIREEVDATYATLAGREDDGQPPVGVQIRCYIEHSGDNLILYVLYG